MQATGTEPTIAQFSFLRGQLAKLRGELIEIGAKSRHLLAAISPEYRASAINLIQYLAARQIDLRPVQLELGRYGFSSLGRMEGHVADALEQVIARLDDALSRAGAATEALPVFDCAVTSDEGDRLLHLHSEALLGSRPPGRHVYVMVTAPDAAAVDEAWASRVLAAGMNVLRVNGAHEAEAQWSHIVQTVRCAATARGAPLRVLVDLPGPKLRTVAPWPGPEVERWRPERDVFGKTVRPCRVTLLPAGARQVANVGASLRVPLQLWRALATGDELRFRDARRRKRRLTVIDRSEQQVIAALERTAYVIPNTKIKVSRRGHMVGKFRVGAVHSRPFRLSLREGDRFRLRADTGETVQPGLLPEIGCCMAEPVLALVPDARVLFDDGKLECIVESNELHGVMLRVTRAPGGSFRLAAEKGINLPDTAWAGPSLTADDERALAFAVKFADIVGASFLRNPEDVRTLYARLEQLGAQRLGVILKIETVAAFRQLPAILLAAMSRYSLGVMIARGDLAVEAGFERMAELQEEILWLCEAAHLPVVWATQVLDQMARTGMATRAEVTDAAMSERAECVMLNKGPYIAEAVTALIDILGRMGDHQYKKRSLYRRLHLALPEALKSLDGASQTPSTG
jgi:pyruvate kinase